MQRSALLVLAAVLLAALLQLAVVVPVRAADVSVDADVEADAAAEADAEIAAEFEAADAAEADAEGEAEGEADAEVAADDELEAEADVEADAEAEALTDAEAEAASSAVAEALSAQQVDAVEEQMIVALLDSARKTRNTSNKGGDGQKAVADWQTFVWRHLMPPETQLTHGGYVTAGAVLARADAQVLGSSHGFAAGKKEVRHLVRRLRSSKGMAKLKKTGSFVLNDVQYKVRTASRTPAPAYVIGRDAKGTEAFVALTGSTVVVQTSSAKPPTWWSERASKMAAYLEKNEL